MLAAQKGALDMVQWILDHDVNINHQDKYQRNCLFYVMKSSADNSDVLRALLEKGAKVDQVDNEGKTPLMKACEYALVHSVKVLLEYKADPNIVNTINGDTAIHMTVRSKSPAAAECVRILIKAGASASVMNKSRKTPLDEALAHKNAGICEILKNGIVEVKKELSPDKTRQETIKSEKKDDGNGVDDEDVKDDIGSTATTNRKPPLPKDVARKKPLAKKAANSPSGIQPSTPEPPKLIPQHEPEPLAEIMSGNKALGFANGILTPPLPQIPKEEVDESQIFALENDVKKKDESISTLLEKIKVNNEHRKKQEDRIANLEKKVREKELYLNKLTLDLQKNDKSLSKVAPEETKLIPLYPAIQKDYIVPKEELYKVLTKDIENFIVWLKSQTTSEKMVREKCLAEIKGVLNEIYPANFDIVPYGSYAADVWLPSSGIDLVIISKSSEISVPQDQILENMKSVIEKKPWYVSGSLVMRAVMGILKIECEIDDITLNVSITIQDSGRKALECVQLVKDYIKTLPFYEPLLLVFKHLFKLGDINDSYTVILLFLKINHRKESAHMELCF